ncbi:127_t:CDS:2 [Paraglomus brasilianum]|uniref:127_t:CDS:1 n=1 Tax=Paraglomus brasilianum TaxID=144538 RepID=A0A9N9H261_9GLOM|nr:127_t:CDS:2 [Paraglomus brasilianum]
MEFEKGVCSKRAAIPEIEDRLNDDEIIALVNGEEAVEECSNSQIERKIEATDAVKSIDMLITFLGHWS